MPTFSVVVPTMNEEEYLPRLFESIKKQTLLPLEVIVADAGSTDSTVKIADEFGARVVAGGLPGPGRNAGAQASTGEIIIFLDADVTLLDERFFEKGIAEFENRKLDIATADITLYEDHSAADQFGHNVYNWYVRLWGSFHPHTIGGFTMVRRFLHDKIGGFDPTIVFCEDHDYGYRARKLGKFAFLNSVKIGMSDRRLDKEGRLKLVIKYILAELHIMFIGPIRHHGFKYEFGYKGKK